MITIIWTVVCSLAPSAVCAIVHRASGQSRLPVELLTRSTKAVDLPFAGQDQGRGPAKFEWSSTEQFFHCTTKGDERWKLLLLSSIETAVVE
jgi:hypothetical protein